ncbi:Protein FAM200B [Eumeta japonica]|uniref:Protein FAM200B n=1 Tax=Eumeta variegata TaxID=151549 RepID=A0A4C1YLX0_EUMVA|nr:Protein FAM200B [Eumeta japonica]
MDQIIRNDQEAQCRRTSRAIKLHVLVGRGVEQRPGSLQILTGDSGYLRDTSLATHCGARATGIVARRRGAACESKFTHTPSKIAKSREPEKTILSLAKKKRKYVEDYLKIRLTCKEESQYPEPQCVICSEVLANSLMKPSLLRRHLETKHPQYVDKPIDFFVRKKEELATLKKTMKTVLAANSEYLRASFLVAYKVAKTGKSYNIAEELTLAATKNMTLESTTKGEDIFNIINDYIEEHGIEWTKCVGISTDGSKAMTGRISYILDGLISSIKNVTPAVKNIDNVKDGWIRNPFLVMNESINSRLSTKQQESLLEMSLDETLRADLKRMSLIDFGLLDSKSIPDSHAKRRRLMDDAQPLRLARAPNIPNGGDAADTGRPIGLRF